jgi:hypothetical protein
MKYKYTAACKMYWTPLPLKTMESLELPPVPKVPLTSKEAVHFVVIKTCPLNVLYVKLQIYVHALCRLLDWAREENTIMQGLSKGKEYVCYYYYYDVKFPSNVINCEQVPLPSHTRIANRTHRSERNVESDCACVRLEADYNSTGQYSLVEFTKRTCPQQTRSTFGRNSKRM